MLLTTRYESVTEVKKKSETPVLILKTFYFNIFCVCVCVCVCVSQVFGEEV